MKEGYADDRINGGQSQLGSHVENGGLIEERALQKPVKKLVEQVEQEQRISRTSGCSTSNCIPIEAEK